MKTRLGRWVLAVVGGLIGISITAASAFADPNGNGGAQTLSGVGGYGIVSIGSSPKEQYYIYLNQPIYLLGQRFQLVLSQEPLPLNTSLDVCAEVEVRGLISIEGCYPYAVITQLHSYTACSETGR